VGVWLALFKARRNAQFGDAGRGDAKPRGRRHSVDRGIICWRIQGIASGRDSPRSWLALGYLIIFGSGIGFSAYLYILQKSTAARVATYAFVNPVVALFLAG